MVTAAAIVSAVLAVALVANVFKEGRRGRRWAGLSR
jgi:hypothetical protein